MIFRKRQNWRIFKFQNFEFDLDRLIHVQSGMHSSSSQVFSGLMSSATFRRNLAKRQNLPTNPALSYTQAVRPSTGVFANIKLMGQKFISGVKWSEKSIPGVPVINKCIYQPEFSIRISKNSEIFNSKIFENFIFSRISVFSNIFENLGIFCQFLGSIFGGRYSQLNLPIFISTYNMYFFMLFLL